MTTTTTTALSPETVKVGDGVTRRVGSDRYAGTVTHVSPSGKTIRFTHDEYQAKADSNYYGSQEYDYSPTPVIHGLDWEGNPVTNEISARWNPKKMAFIVSGTRSSVRAGRDTYFDPSF